MEKALLASRVSKNAHKGNAHSRMMPYKRERERELSAPTKKEEHLALTIVNLSKEDKKSSSWEKKNGPETQKQPQFIVCIPGFLPHFCESSNFLRVPDSLGLGGVVYESLSHLFLLDYLLESFVLEFFLKSSSIGRIPADAWEKAEPFVLENFLRGDMMSCWEPPQ